MICTYKFDKGVSVLCEYEIIKEQIIVKPLDYIGIEIGATLTYSKLDFMKHLEEIPKPILSRLLFT
jgi:hypothetical protein